MVLQTGAVLQFFLGRDTGWSTQHRDDGSIPLNEILVRHSWHMLIGIFASVSALMMAPALWGWMSPTLLSLVFAVPISVATGKISLGSALKHVGLLVTPEETSPPPIATRANMLMREYSA